MQAFAVGVDLGATNLRIAAIDAAGRKLDTIETRTQPDRTAVIEKMTSAIRALATEYERKYRFLGVGVGVPGVIDLAQGTVHSASNLPEWNDYPLAQDLEFRLGVPVLLENDANCAALGENWIGAGKGIDDLCMLTLGTGVGGGILMNGRPWHGVAGMAGEVGHMTVIPDGRACGCGNHGCLEQYASASAIRRLAAEAIARGEPTELAQIKDPKRELTAKAVFQAAMRDDRVAKQVFEIAGTALGIALANLINILNLPLYVLGGGLAQAWKIFSPSLFHELQKRSIVFRTRERLEPATHSTRICPTQLGGDAGLIGAARMPMIDRCTESQCRPAVQENVG
jgi:glucokinase